jgi:hypothetical protein
LFGLTHLIPPFGFFVGLNYLPQTIVGCKRNLSFYSPLTLTLSLRERELAGVLAIAALLSKTLLYQA